MNSTEVTFPGGALRGESRVLAVHPLADGRHGVVTESTPFHPVDHTWPDQPGDSGTLGGHTVSDTLTAASQGTEILVAEDIPVRRGDEDWTWLVLHVIEGEPPDLGANVELVVDAPRRAALSAGHTGCHLVAFALNAVLAERWRKEVRLDSLGNPDFDSLAMDSSRIHENGSTDVYRVGKSLRKKGFTPGELAEDATSIAERVNERLAGWLDSAAEVTVHTDGPLLTDRRRWSCALAEGEASVSCGGTHLRSLAELSALHVSIEVTPDQTGLTVRTTAKPAPGTFG